MAIGARSARFVAALLLAAGVMLCLAGCQSSASPEPKGFCQPTCAGSGGAAYANFEEARRAFTRSTGDFTATLEDLSWLRFEGDEETIVEKHRAYFEQGYTTFEVVLLTKDFTQPTAETFVLEDSGGTRLQGRPLTYQGAMGMEQERFAARFSLSFRHAITRDLAWIRLRRAADGETLEWTFDEAGAAPSAAAGASGPSGAPRGKGSVVPAGRVVKGRAYDPAARAEVPADAAAPSLNDGTAPGSIPGFPARERSVPSTASGRPLNLLQHPEAFQPSQPRERSAPPALAQDSFPLDVVSPNTVDVGEELPPLPPPPSIASEPAAPVAAPPVSAVPPPVGSAPLGPAPAGSSLPPPAARRLNGVRPR